MSLYLVFFGKSQDFLATYYDSTNYIHNFNDIVKDFEYLESKVFTVDDVKNKEILARYFFLSNSKKFCLVKLYSFAQAFSGNRIAGSIFGVGLISDRNIDFTNDNLSLLRAAKDKFSQLSLDGFKFIKSNFQDDTDRIWKAIVSNNNGNLLDKVTTSEFKLNSGNVPAAFYVKNLFADAIKLNDRVKSENRIYLSEDLDHLIRTQAKWGKDKFPVFWENNNHNNQFVLYQKNVSSNLIQPSKKSLDIGSTRLQNELEDLKNHIVIKDSEVRNLKKRNKLFLRLIIIQTILVILLILYIVFLSHTEVEKKESQPISSEDSSYMQEPVALPSVESQTNYDSFPNFLVDETSLDNGIKFLSSIDYVYNFDEKKSIADTLRFYREYETIKVISNQYNIQVDNIDFVFMKKREAIKITLSK